jgi:phage regulator Rha-like protein
MQIANISNAQTMTSREIAELTGKEISHVHRDIRVMIEQLGDDPELDHITEDRDSRAYVTCIHLTKNLTYTLVSGYNVKMRKAIIDRWQELEAKQVAPIELSRMDILMLAMESEKGRLLAIEQRDQAIATKAHIGSKRESTAMATASQAVKKATKLEIELDKSKEYATVKRMEMLYHGTKFNWRLLKSTAIEMELPPIDVFDANYGKVNAYHASVWLEAYAVSVDGQA